LKVASLLGSDAGMSALAEGWNEDQRADLHAKIAARQPFLDFAVGRTDADGSTRQFRVSGEPMFDSGCLIIGYRGIGVEITPGV
jgi:hypothetical protein